MFCVSILEPEIAVIDSGISRRLSSLFLAVTTISSIPDADSTDSSDVSGNVISPKTGNNDRILFRLIIPPQSYF